jgi:hypothetical protein
MRKLLTRWRILALLTTLMVPAVVYAAQNTGTDECCPCPCAK